MEYLRGREGWEAEVHLRSAAKYAEESGCSRAKCGAVIVSQERIIGAGFNSPAGGKESRRRCGREKSEYAEKVTDKTCCVHAEQRAIIDALHRHPNDIKESTMYFVRLDKNIGLSDRRRPYCTICSKIIVDVGIKYFVRYQNESIVRYDAEEYDSLSADYTPSL